MTFSSYPRAAAVIGCATVLVLGLAAPAWASCHQALFSPDAVTVGEDDGKVILTVTNPGNLDRIRTVGYQTIAGTAKSGTDFVAESGTLSFSPSNKVQTFDITILDDTADEAVERFAVRLKLREGSCITDLGPDADVTVADDDVQPKPTATREEETPPAPPPPAGGSGNAPPDSTTGSSDPPIGGTIGPAPTPSATDVTPTPTATRTVFAAVDLGEGGGLSGFAIAGIVVGGLVVGSIGALVVRETLATRSQN
ncbi:MAG: Calx-beta domain-containing protein [Actinomycetota bacterium]